VLQMNQVINSSVLGLADSFAACVFDKRTKLEIHFRISSIHLVKHISSKLTSQVHEQVDREPSTVNMSVICNHLYNFFCSIYL
jgi:hypothetical protein